MNDLEVEVHQPPPMWSDNTLNRVQLSEFLCSDLCSTIRRQCEMSVPRDTAIAGAVGERGLMFLIDWSQREEI